MTFLTQVRVHVPAYKLEMYMYMYGKCDGILCLSTSLCVYPCCLLLIRAL